MGTYIIKYVNLFNKACEISQEVLGRNLTKDEADLVCIAVQEEDIYVPYICHNEETEALTISFHKESK